jgi:hypothetical protein
VASVRATHSRRAPIFIIIIIIIFQKPTRVASGLSTPGAAATHP